MAPVLPAVEDFTKTTVQLPPPSSKCVSVAVCRRERIVQRTIMGLYQVTTAHCVCLLNYHEITSTCIHLFFCVANFQRILYLSIKDKNYFLMHTISAQGKC